MSKEIPKVEESSKFNFFTSIWIVPFIAIIIAAWLAYQYFSELGPEIRIIFAKNEGLQAGQSHIKYRDVVIGKVSRIELEEHGKGVEVVVRMDKTASSYLNEHSKFWIVKPEVGMSGITGLDTLISGTYIDMYAEKDGELKDKFVGLEHAYRDIGNGEYFVLNTPRGDSSVKVGTPIYLKNVQVGQVEYVVLALDDASVDVIVYIEKQYVPYIHMNSKFWTRSTLDVGLSGGSLDIAVAPITDLIQGAIEFSTFGRDINNTVSEGYVFRLHKNKNTIENKKVGKGGAHIKIFMLRTHDAIAKLKVNAVVRYGGFDVGKVKGIKLNYNKKTHQMNGEVLVAIDTSVFLDASSTDTTGNENFYLAVSEGLRASIIPTDPITGLLYVDLSFNYDDGNKSIENSETYALLPTVSYKSGNNIMTSATKVLDKINNLKLEKLLASLNTVVDDTGKVVNNAGSLVNGEDSPLMTVLADLKKTIKNFNKMTNKKTFTRMPDEVSRALHELTRTLKTTKKVVKGYGNNSLISHQIAQTLKVVTKTSQEMQHFLKMLNRKPNSLIFGDK